MTKLIMDSSTSFLYILLLQEETVLWKYLEEGNNDHSEKLNVLIKKMLEDTKIEIANIDQIIVGRGPGSYTGVRVSMTVAKTFAWAKKIPLYTFGSLDMIASSKMIQNGVYVVMLDARRGNSFVKIIESKNHCVTTLLEDAFMSNQAIEELVASKYPNAIIVNQVERSSFDYEVLISFHMIHKVEDIYGFVPNYVRSGV